MTRKFYILVAAVFCISPTFVLAGQEKDICSGTITEFLQSAKKDSHQAVKKYMHDAWNIPRVPEGITGWKIREFTTYDAATIADAKSKGWKYPIQNRAYLDVKGGDIDAFVLIDHSDGKTSIHTFLLRPKNKTCSIRDHIWWEDAG